MSTSFAALTRFMAIYLLFTILESGCQRNVQSLSTTAPAGSYDLLPTNVTFSVDPGNQNAMTVKYSVLNVGTSAVPTGAFDVEFYIDNKLENFDRASPPIPEHEKVDYTFKCRIGSGEHTYRVGLATRKGLQDRDGLNREVAGRFTAEK